MRQINDTMENHWGDPKNYKNPIKNIEVSILTPIVFLNFPFFESDAILFHFTKLLFFKSYRLFFI